MKRKTLLSLTASALILTAPFQAKSVTLLGEAMFTHAMHVNPLCHVPLPKPTCLNPLTDINIPVTSWFDIPLGIVTGLDALATYDQSEKSVDVQDALKKLNKKLEPGCSDEQEDGSDSSLSPVDNLPVAPDIVASKLDEQGDAFDYVRTAAESFLTESENCNRDCMVERQNTWLLTSLALAHGTADKLLSTSRDMKKEYQDLLSDFNRQTGPKGFWGSSAKITLHSHVQQNDINALYARDLEINALNGVRESNEAKK
jgi:hypothetical protein